MLNWGGEVAHEIQNRRGEEESFPKGGSYQICQKFSGRGKKGVEVDINPGPYVEKREGRDYSIR